MGKQAEPLVSVIIPTYGRPDLLRSAVESVLHQTYSNIELLVVDDHSPISAEKTLLPVSRGEIQSTRIIRHEENKGANVARNTGIRNADGTFIAFLDDDDRWDPTKIERQVAVFQETADTVGVVYTGQRFINDNGDTTSIHISKLSGDITKQLLGGARIAPFSSVMVQAEFILHAGLPDERFPCWQDKEWYVRLSQHCEFESIPEPLVIRIVGSHDQISDNYIQKREIAYPLFLEKYQSLAASYGPVCRRKMEAALMRKLGKHALSQQQYHESRKQLVRSVIHYPFELSTYLYLIVSIGGRAGHTIAKTLRRAYKKYRFSNLT